MGSTDGDWIYFVAFRDGGLSGGLWRKRAESPESSADFIMKHEGPNLFLSSISRNGDLLTYILRNPTFDIWMVHLNQESPEASPSSTAMR